MSRLPKHEAESLAEQIHDALRPHIIKVIAELLAEQDPDELSARDRAKVERAAARIRRQVEGVPPQKARRQSS